MRKFRTALTAAMVIVPVVMVSTAGFAQAGSASHNQMCRSVFMSNKTTIESMAGAGNTAGIQAILARAGCSEFGVKIAKPPGSAEKSKITISCKITIDPPGIDCTITFLRAVPVSNTPPPR